MIIKSDWVTRHCEPKEHWSMEISPTSLLEQLPPVDLNDIKAGDKVLIMKTVPDDIAIKNFWSKNPIIALHIPAPKEDKAGLKVELPEKIWESLATSASSKYITSMDGLAERVNQLIQYLKARE